MKILLPDLKKAITICFFVLSASISIVSAAPVELSYSIFLPETTILASQMERWKQQVEKKSYGTLAIKTYPGGKLLKALETMDGVISGKADIGVVVMAYEPARFPVTNAVSLPINIPNARVGSLVLWKLYNKYKPKSFKDVQVIGMFTTPPINLMTKTPVRSLADIKGMSIRAAGGPADILRAWGASAVPMPLTRKLVSDAFEKNKIQGVFTSLDYMKDIDLARDCPYVTITNSVVYPIAVIMNNKKWNSLPDKARIAIKQVRREHMEWTGNELDKHIKTSVEWSKKTHNVEFINLIQSQKTKFHFLTRSLTSKWLQKARADKLPGTKIVTDLKKWIKEYSK
ncbi:TRAP transporter substrate-binding protein DctP [Desulfobacterales bacterium HSG16]|nr:TRAP transporter substrate-binding protein DctP [Desulfobacterales bacterium HSG16]